MSAAVAASAAFDQVAGQYDLQDLSNPIRQWMRRSMRERSLQWFKPGQHILEINCGTGEDALWLARHGMHVTALDASPKMIELLQRKIERLELSDRITALVLANEDLAALPAGPFDGALSNFGGLNYVEDLQGVACALRGLLKPGAAFIASLASRHCLFEVLAYAAKRRWRQASRRWTTQAYREFPEGLQAPVYFHRPRDIRRAFASHFDDLRFSGLGILLPPPYLSALYERHTRLFSFLERLENRIRELPPLSYLGDHLIIEGRRKP